MIKKVLLFSSIFVFSLLLIGCSSNKNATPENLKVCDAVEPIYRDFELDNLSVKNLFDDLDDAYKLNCTDESISICTNIKDFINNSTLIESSRDDVLPYVKKLKTECQELRD